MVVAGALVLFLLSQPAPEDARVEYIQLQRGLEARRCEALHVDRAGDLLNNSIAPCQYVRVGCAPGLRARLRIRDDFRAEAMSSLYDVP